MISEKLSTDSRRMLQKGVPQFVGFCRCTPCRQRRGKGFPGECSAPGQSDAPRAGSAEAKLPVPQAHQLKIAMHPVQAAPRQSSTMQPIVCLLAGMHPVQAAPRQSRCVTSGMSTSMMHPVQAAPRQSVSDDHHRPAHHDAPRAGSAEAKQDQRSADLPKIGMHPVRAAPRQSR